MMDCRVKPGNDENGQNPPSLRGAKRRSNPSIPVLRYGLLRFARNDVVGLGANFAQSINMTLKLFELVGTDQTRPFSPYCWRTRMALAHKGLSAETIPWCFTEKNAIVPHGSEKVPVLLDGDTAVVDSWTIANYLEDT